MTAFTGKIFILDLANNHFGNLNHALETLHAIHEEVKDLDQTIVLKLQLRDLPTYIRKDFQERLDLHYIRRFSETRLSFGEFREILSVSKSLGFKTMATPFDEKSCETFSELGLDFVKVASASSNDFKLLDNIVRLAVPTVASTGGLSESQVQMLHDFLASHSADFALMHCVSIYPAPDELLQLRQIENFVELFPGVPIGWSTHEAPGNMLPVALATSLGASLFERHVGLSSEKYSLNAYSSSPRLVRNWIQSALHADLMLGSKERLPTSRAELESLHSLKRGIFVRRDIAAGEEIHESDTYSAFPLEIDGIESGTARFPLVSKELIAGDGPILKTNLATDHASEDRVAGYLREIRKILRRSGVALNMDARLELSHHYGLERFREFGVAMFTCINRNYAKKILVVLPRQKHPVHYHDMKEESFQLLWGDVQINVNGTQNQLRPGQILTVLPREWHKFTSLNGCVLEEISTHHSSGDSFYEDPNIKSGEPKVRKTTIEWLDFAQ
jgi:sialic acid synthase SpsE/mannose-6-phosphate isomerase-like protein (cupin superfamily)